MPLVRQRWLRRGARRGGGELTDPAGAIRPAVEAALAVAREGLSADPIVPPPQALRRYLEFSKLLPGALRAIARVVERDDAFRARVAASVDEERVGRAGWLWLARPEGWAEELAAIDAEEAARAEEEQRVRDERSAVRKLAAAQAAAATATAEADRRAREAEELRAELARQRALQADVAARLVEAESQADRLAAARTEAVRNLKDVEARLVERSTELNTAKARIRELEQQARSRGDVTGDGVGPAPAPDGDLRPPGPARGASADAGGEPRGGASGESAGDGGRGPVGGARSGVSAGDSGGGSPTGARGGSGNARSSENAVGESLGQRGVGPRAGARGDESVADGGRWRFASGVPAGDSSGGPWGGARGGVSLGAALPSRGALAEELARAAAGAASLADSLAALAQLLEPTARTGGAARPDPAAAGPAPGTAPQAPPGSALPADSTQLDGPSAADPGDPATSDVAGAGHLADPDSRAGAADVAGGAGLADRASSGRAADMASGAAGSGGRPGPDMGTGTAGGAGGSGAVAGAGPVVDGKRADAGSGIARSAGRAGGATAGPGSGPDAAGGSARPGGEARGGSGEAVGARDPVGMPDSGQPALVASGPTVRVPVRLPGGIFDDSVAAAEHLLRTVGVVLVVDGYNVTMTGWPSLSAAEQRWRLVGVLAELAARTATEIEIVFDGADVASVPVPARVRSLVHVRFSPPGVEADDVVLDLVASLPAARPVVVASSDNRVRDGARALGANVVHARQLLDTLQR